MIPELAEWQFALGDVVLGAGTDIPVGNVEGLGTAEARTQDADNPAGDGVFPGVDLYGARTVRLEAGIRTPAAPDRALDLLARLQQTATDPAVRLTPGAMNVLRMRWPGRPARRLYGRLRRVEATSTATAVSGWIPLDLEFVAADPLFYADDTSTLTLPLSAGGLGGLRAPLVAPLTTGVAIPHERRGWVTNGGDRPAWPSLRITGPCTHPRIRHAETGQVIELAVALQTGEHIDIETRPGTRWVLKDGAHNLAPALSAASRLDFALPPGTSELWWTARNYTNSTRLRVTWHAAHAAL
ncbi:hypothetical protein [Streptomyces sp. CC224B]|uniref:phage distal tail protein n=1 Tax=Streptomyces sp. CC224B TaxID=3044571 RepID=UPI0024A821FA|nr:hypothetical protein [Streptomyces sp. CC224B]